MHEVMSTKKNDEPKSKDMFGAPRARDRYFNRVVDVGDAQGVNVVDL